MKNFFVKILGSMWFDWGTRGKIATWIVQAFASVAKYPVSIFAAIHAKRFTDSPVKPLREPVQLTVDTVTDILASPVMIGNETVGAFTVGQNDGRGYQVIKTRIRPDAFWSINDTGSSDLLNMDGVDYVNLPNGAIMMSIGNGGWNGALSLSGSGAATKQLSTVYGIKNNYRVNDFAAIMGIQMSQDVADMIYPCWDVFVNGMTSGRLLKLISLAYRIDTARVAGTVTSEWVEGARRFITIDDAIHSAPANLAAVPVGTTVSEYDKIFSGIDIWDSENLPDYQALPYLAIDGRIVPNYPVAVTSGSSGKYIELPSSGAYPAGSTGSPDDGGSFQIPVPDDTKAYANPLEILLRTYFGKSVVLVTVSGGIVAGDRLAMVYRAISSVIPVGTCVKIIEIPAVSSISIGVTGSSVVCYGNCGEGHCSARITAGAAKTIRM